MGMFGTGKKPQSPEPIVATDGPGTAKAITPSKDNDAAAAASAPPPKKHAGFAVDDKEAAAAKIQAIKRGKQDRAKLSEEKEISKMREDREKAAAKIQAISKGRKTREDMKSGVVGGKKGPLAAIGDAWKAMLAKIDTAAIMDMVKCTKCLAPKPKRAADLLSKAVREKVNFLFQKMDTDGDGHVDEAEAVAFFKSYAKLNARAMLNEVDTDRNGSATYEEFCDFWANVMTTGNYEEAEILEELDNILKGEGWTDFDDGRTT